MSQSDKNAAAGLVLGIILCFVWPPLGLFLIVLALLSGASRPASPGDAHGTARLATVAEAQRAKLFGRKGRSLVLGRAGPLGGGRRLLRLAQSAVVHLASFAPPGAGKNTGQITPNLIEYRGSAVVIDLKGESYRLTARHRRRRLGHWVGRLDPYRMFGAGGERLNPLDFIDENAPDFIDECKALAHALVFQKGTEPDPHWNESAALVIYAFIGFVCVRSPSRQQRTLRGVRWLLASRERFELARAAMQKTTGYGGVIAMLGDELSWFTDRELSSVLASVQRHTNFLDSPLIAEFTDTTTFEVQGLRDRRSTLYICLPHDKLDAFPGLTRLIVTVLLRALTRGEPSERRPVVFFLDEVAQLGRLQELERAATLYRGMGIRLWFFFQSLAQVRECYGERAQIVLDCIKTQMYFGITSLETARAVSERIGDYGRFVMTHGESQSRSRPDVVHFQPQQPGSWSTSSSSSRTEIARRLLKPEEVLTLPPDLCLIFHGHLRVVPATLLAYYRDPEFRGFRRGWIGRCVGVLCFWRLLPAIDLEMGAADVVCLIILAVIVVSIVVGLLHA